VGTQKEGGAGSALAAVVWCQQPSITVLGKDGGMGNWPDPLKILIVRRCDGAIASMPLPASLRPAFQGLERNVVRQHAVALEAAVRAALPGLLLRPGDPKSLAAVLHGPNRATPGTLRVFGRAIGYDLCDVDVSAAPCAPEA